MRRRRDVHRLESRTKKNETKRSETSCTQERVGGRTKVPGYPSENAVAERLEPRVGGVRESVHWLSSGGERPGRAAGRGHQRESARRTDFGTCVRRAERRGKKAAGGRKRGRGRAARADSVMGRGGRKKPTQSGGARTETGTHPRRRRRGVASALAAAPSKKSSHREARKRPAVDEARLGRARATEQRRRKEGVRSEKGDLATCGARAAEAPEQPKESEPPVSIAFGCETTFPTRRSRAKQPIPPMANRPKKGRRGLSGAASRRKGRTRDGGDRGKVEGRESVPERKGRELKRGGETLVPRALRCPGRRIQCRVPTRAPTRDHPRPNHRRLIFCASCSLTIFSRCCTRSSTRASTFVSSTCPRKSSPST